MGYIEPYDLHSLLSVIPYLFGLELTYKSMVTSALSDPVMNLYRICTKLLYLVFIYWYIITYKQAP